MGRLTLEEIVAGSCISGSVATLMVPIIRWGRYSIQRTPFGIAFGVSTLIHGIMVKENVLKNIFTHKKGESGEKYVLHELALTGLITVLTTALYTILVKESFTQDTLMTCMPGCAIGCLAVRMTILAIHLFTR
ncbi:MAG: hypothetical protein JWO53_194 [Chlamydiia bacterium]|nr:hypothetical protein [Chlamydiia bacterium]